MKKDMEMNLHAQRDSREIHTLQEKLKKVKKERDQARQNEERLKENLRNQQDKHREKVEKMEREMNEEKISLQAEYETKLTQAQNTFKDQIKTLESELKQTEEHNGHLKRELQKVTDDGESERRRLRHDHDQEINQMATDFKEKEHRETQLAQEALEQEQASRLAERSQAEE